MSQNEFLIVMGSVSGTFFKETPTGSILEALFFKEIPKWGIGEMLFLDNVSEIDPLSIILK